MLNWDTCAFCSVHLSQYLCNNLNAKFINAKLLKSFVSGRTLFPAHDVANFQIIRFLFCLKRFQWFFGNNWRVIWSLKRKIADLMRYASIRFPNKKKDYGRTQPHIVQTLLKLSIVITLNFLNLNCLDYLNT